jgi:hypothetical protein
VIGDDAVRSMADQPAATAGGPGPEPCRDCRAPLVPGQRYCLYCGARVPEARLEFLDVLVQDIAGVGPAPEAAAAAGGAPPVVVASSASRGGGVNGWLRHNAPVLGLTGIILGTLLIGLLIGHWATSGSDHAPSQAAAPVVRVEQPAAAAAPASGTATTDAAAADAGSGSGSGSDSGDAAGSGKSSAKAAKKDASAAKDAAAKDTAKAPAGAVNTQDLAGQDKEKAIEKAAKQGKPIATGDGKLPPTDDKAPAGGAGFDVIG